MNGERWWVELSEWEKKYIDTRYTEGTSVMGKIVQFDKKERHLKAVKAQGSECSKLEL